MPCFLDEKDTFQSPSDPNNQAMSWSNNRHRFLIDGGAHHVVGYWEYNPWLQQLKGTSKVYGDFDGAKEPLQFFNASNKNAEQQRF